MAKESALDTGAPGSLLVVVVGIQGRAIVATPLLISESIECKTEIGGGKDDEPEVEEEQA